MKRYKTNEGTIIGRNGLFPLEAVEVLKAKSTETVFIDGVSSRSGKVINGGICFDIKTMDQICKDWERKAEEPALHCVVHEHKHGKDQYLFRSKEDRTDFAMPYEDPTSEILELVKLLDIDFEPKKGETIEVVCFYNSDNIPTIRP